MTSAPRDPDRRSGGFGVQFHVSFRPNGRLAKISFSGWGARARAREVAEISSPPTLKRYATVSEIGRGYLVAAGHDFGERHFPTMHAAREWAGQRGVVLIIRSDVPTDR